MKKISRLDLDDLRVDSFATVDRSPTVRGTVHANADLDTRAPGCVIHVPNSDGCMETWDICPSEYRTACESETDQYTCTVPAETEPGPA